MSVDRDVLLEIYWEYVNKNKPLDKAVLAGHMLRLARRMFNEHDFEDLEMRWEKCVRISVLVDSYLRYLRKLYKDSPFPSELLPHVDRPGGDKQAVAPTSIESAERVFETSEYKGVVLSLAKILPQLYREIDDIVCVIISKAVDRRRKEAEMGEEG